MYKYITYILKFNIDVKMYVKIEIYFIEKL
jgi:hypothetical protein